MSKSVKKYRFSDVGVSGSCAMGLLTLSIFAASPCALASETAPHFDRVIADWGFWQQKGAVPQLKKYASLFTEISPAWYFTDRHGQVIPQNCDHQRCEDAALVEWAHEQKMLVLPLVGDDQHVMAELLAKPRVTQRHVQNLVKLVIEKNYDGLDIDYEDFTANDRENYTDFIEDLARALHERGKILSVSVFAKTSPYTGRTFTPAAQNYAALGQIADEVRIMAYDFSEELSGPGAVAPYPWVRRVLRYAQLNIPREKLVFGFSLYGYDWTEDENPALGTEYGRLRRMITEGKVKFLGWDRRVRAPYLRYADDQGKNHLVWYENVASIRERVTLAAKRGVSGIFFWSITGAEDEGIWDYLTNRKGKNGAGQGARTLDLHVGNVAL